MKRRTLTLLALLAVSPPLAAQTRPAAAELFARYVQALGGRAVLEKMASRHVWGRFEVPAQGVGGPIEILTAAPAMILTKIEIPGMGAITSGYDGEVGWAINPAMGPIIMDGNALNQMKQQADFNASITDKYVKSRETTGESEQDGKPCWSVTVKTVWDETYTECYEKSTGLLVGVVRKQSSPMGEIEATSTMSDYKAFGGVMMATTVRISAMGIEQVLHIDSVSTKPIPASVFALPPEIKALRK